MRSFVVVDPQRGDRRLEVELWYPAMASLAGQDQDDATRDRFRIPVPGSGRMKQSALRDAQPAELPTAPFIVFSHGNGGHRRQSTFLTTHLASHGFVVAALDHTGNTMAELMDLTPLQQGAAVATSGRNRPLDVRATVDHALATDTELGNFTATRIDPDRIGVTGHSFGGWTAIKALAADRRLRCALPLGPPGILEASDNPLGIGDTYGEDVDPGRDAPVFLVAADRDSLCRLDGIETLFQRLTSERWLAVLSPADHFHFGDFARLSHRLFSQLLASGAMGTRIEKMAPFDELMGEALGEEIVRALATAFFRWQLMEDEQAATWLLERLGAEHSAHLEIRHAAARARSEPRI